jgi:hypothetical protein
MNAYYKKSYIETINPYGDTKERWIYACYSSSVDIWTFRDETGSSEINMCFEDTSDNKLTCIWEIYMGLERIEITEKEYNNLL